MIMRRMPRFWTFRWSLWTRRRRPSWHASNPLNRWKAGAWGRSSGLHAGIRSQAKGMVPSWANGTQRAKLPPSTRWRWSGVSTRGACGARVLDSAGGGSEPGRGRGRVLQPLGRNVSSDGSGFPCRLRSGCRSKRRHARVMARLSDLSRRSVEPTFTPARIGSLLPGSNPESGEVKSNLHLGRRVEWPGGSPAGQTLQPRGTCEQIRPSPAEAPLL
jgi:hypothetical protein